MSEVLARVRSMVTDMLLSWKLGGSSGHSGSVT